jgi:hypothetical protein
MSTGCTSSLDTAAHIYPAEYLVVDELAITVVEDATGGFVSYIYLEIVVEHIVAVPGKIISRLAGKQKAYIPGNLECRSDCVCNWS